MKIANIMRRLAFDEWGGTETAVWNSSKSLLAYGDEIGVYATKALCPVSEEIADGIRIRRFDYFYPYLFLSKKSKSALDKKGGNPFSFDLYKTILEDAPDIVHSHAMGRLAKQARKAARKLDVPFVVSFHGGCYDVPTSETKDMAKPIKGKIGYGRILEILNGLNFDVVESADGVICVGENELAEVRKRFPRKKTVLIPNGVDAEKFSVKPYTDFRKKYSIRPTSKLVLCVSRIDPQKNQKALVSLTANLLSNGIDAHCAVIGFPTSQTYLHELKSAIAMRGLTDRFTIIEGLPPDSDELISAYKSADVFVLPSVHEPFGIVALEAWSAGLPLAAARVGGLKYLIQEGKTGFSFAPDSEEEILRACIGAMSNSESLKPECAKLAREKYSWNSVAKSLRDFYSELINDD